MNKLIILLAFAVLSLSLVGSQEAFAVDYSITDQASCENAPVLGMFDSGTCILDGTHTIPLLDRWFFQIDTRVTGTVDAFGTISLEAPFSNSGEINVIGSNIANAQGVMRIASATVDYNNECNGIINLIGGALPGTGQMLILGSGGFTPTFNNFGTITGTNSNQLNLQGTIHLFALTEPVVFNNHGTITAPVRLAGVDAVFNDNLPNQCGVIGGEIIPIDNIALLLSGSQILYVWMVPAIVILAGTSAFLAYRKSENS